MILSGDTSVPVLVSPVDELLVYGGQSCCLVCIVKSM